MIPKRYIGDGVFVEFDGGIVLTTEDGIKATNRIVLEPEVYTMLVEFVADVEQSFMNASVSDE
ncbi:MAG TPA: hypothetical protein VFB63_00665 [Bryobacteraceae bacterium]|nr:hypothetical protein [Bryobacteraceae bacterium]